MGALLLVWLVAGAAAADVPVESIGSVEVLPSPASPSWIWASDPVLRRTTLVDLETGRTLGMLDGGFGFTVGVFPASRTEIYVPATYYSRGSRGDRTDVVTFYDSVTLAPVGEVVIPGKRAINPLPTGNTALTDDDRFLAVFNMTPATSLSIVDVEQRVFVAEIATPGCSLAYGAGARRFATLCSDGTMMTVTLDDSGREAGRARTAAFFDPLKDPVTEKAVRRGDRWYFVSFEGVVHEVDIGGDAPQFLETWSLVDDADRAGSWRIGGRQHLAVHRATGRLFALMHQGGIDTHKQPGSELWVYDLAERRRLQRIELSNPGFTYLGVSMEFGQDWIWPFHRLYDWLLSLISVPELGVGSVQVTQGPEPVIVTGSDFSGSLALYDGLSGRFLRRIITGNMTTLAIHAPFEPSEAGR